MKALWKKEELLTATKGLDPSSDFLKKMEGAFGVCIDDRTIKKGDLFIAIKGENFDGHDFIESAVLKGASGVIVSDKQHALEYKGLLVKDTKIALKNIAYFSRNRFFGKVIAITGSSGKTSTKHILSTSLQKFGKTHFTQGNNNNIIGLSLTLSRLPKDYKFCVLELGMNHTGEIKELTKISKPDLALITNVSNSHIENFKNEKEIAKAKSEIFIGLSKSGVAIINADNLWSDYLKQKAKKYTNNIYLYGSKTKSNIKVKNIIDEKEGSTVFLEKMEPLHLKYLSSVQATNVIATIAILKQLNLSVKKVTNIFSEIKPLSGRGEKIKINFDDNQESLIIDDSYNANPASMRASLNNLYKIKSKLHDYETILIIGDMLELGKNGITSHLDLIPIIKKINPDLLITVGELTELICNELKIKSCSYHHIDPLLLDIKNIIKPKQLIFIKGSNGTNLWKLVKFLRTLNQEGTYAA